MQLQHVNVKLLVQNPEEVDLEALIPVFHGWIEAQGGDELLLDVADYRHVDASPGVVLIGHHANFSVDNANRRLGIRYNRKAVFDGSNQDRLRQAARAALLACQRLEAEPSLGGKLRFNGQEIEISINDRLLAPNREATREAVNSDFQAFSRRLFAGNDCSVSYGSDSGDDPRRLFSVYIKSSQPFLLADLLENLS